MEGLPWAQIGVGSAGWVSFLVLAFLVLRKMISGDLVTRREADAKDAEAVRLRQSNDYLQEQLGQALTALAVVNEVLPALRAAAEEPRP